MEVLKIVECVVLRFFWFFFIFKINFIVKIFNGIYKEELVKIVLKELEMWRRGK